jgi:hypothetical protein
MLSIFIATKVEAGHLVLPCFRSGFRKERIGSSISPHLNGLVESIYMNVGGLLVEVSSPPMKPVSVGGVIVLGGRESRLHGEGRQLVGISTHISRMRTQGNP